MECCRWIGSVRRDLLDHVVIFNERHLRRLLAEYVAHYQNDRTHLGLDKSTPGSRSVDPCPAGDAEVVALPRLGEAARFPEMVLVPAHDARGFDAMPHLTRAVLPAR